MSLLTDTVHREMVKYLVQKAIICPRTDQVLDVRTCVVLLDSDGDPTAALSQDGYRDLVDSGQEPYLKSEYGIIVDSSTVKAVKA